MLSLPGCRNLSSARIIGNDVLAGLAVKVYSDTLEAVPLARIRKESSP
jgi:hypothetical protein